MQNSGWWRAPRQITNQIHDRKISWLELFSDLVYVAIIHLVTVNLANHWNWTGIITFVLAFLLIFNSWQNVTWFYDLHGDDSLRTTVLLLLQVIAISLVALFLPAIFAGEWRGFLWTYFIVQGLITYLWWSTGHFDPDHRVTSWPYVRFYLVAELILLIAALLPSPAIAFGTLALVLILDYGAPLFLLRQFNNEYTSRSLRFELSAAILERYGQFTMIILGEALADIIDHGLEHVTVNSLLTFVISLIFVIGLWWLYYMLMDNVTVQGNSFQPLLWFRLTHTLWLLLLTGLVFSTSYLSEGHLTGISWWFTGLSIAILLILVWLADWPKPKLTAPHLTLLAVIILLFCVAHFLPLIGQSIVSAGALLGFIFDHERRTAN